MIYTILVLIILGLLSFLFYNTKKNRKVVTEFDKKVQRLQSMIDREQGETRTLLAAYLTESQVTKFYEDSAAFIKDEDVIQLFTKLAKDEKKHIALLEKCLAQKNIK